MTIKQKIIIDTDPGIDDAMAIHYAFADERLDVLGLSTIFGNVWTNQATRNALFLCAQAEYDALVAEGAEEPLVIPANQPSHYVHGNDGFGDVIDIDVNAKADERSALDFICDLCEKYPNEVILCPIGPLTNIAQIIGEAPEVIPLVKKVVIMGGAVDVKGNVTPYAEANIWNDPHSADVVFSAEWDIELIGLDVTEQITCDAEYFATLAQKAPKIGGFLRDISKFYIDFYEGVRDEKLCVMHDPAAVISITNSDYFTYEEMRLEVIMEGEEIGKVVRSDDLSRPLVRVAKTVDVEACRKSFLDICGESDTMAQKRVMAR